MKSKSMIISASIIILIIAGVLILLKLSGNPILPQSYDLACHEKGSGNYIMIDNECNSIADCQELVNTYCGPENSCDNERLECKNNKCVTTVHFKLNTRCV